MEEGAEPLSVLAALAGTVRGRRRSPRTLTRWVTEGVRGFVLEAYHDGTRWYSSRAALARFLAVLTQCAEEAVERTPAPTPKRQRAEVMAAVNRIESLKARVRERCRQPKV